MVAAAVLVSKLQTPVYQTEAEILLQSRVSESVLSSGGGSGPARTVETEAPVITSEAVRRAVRENLEAAPRISASRVGETEVMTVRALSIDPERAATAANAYAYADAYVSYRSIDWQFRQAPAPEQAAAEARSGSRYTSLLSQQSLLQQKLDEVQVEGSLKSGGLIWWSSLPRRRSRSSPSRCPMLLRPW